VDGAIEHRKGIKTPAPGGFGHAGPRADSKKLESLILAQSER